MKVFSYYQHLRESKSPQFNIMLGFFAYIILGWVLLSLPFLQKQDTSFLDNLFISASAVSTTGLVTISVFDSYNIGGQMVVMLLFQVGGIGYMSLTTYYILSTTRKITPWHERMVNASFAMPKDFKVQDFIPSVIFFTAIMETFGVVCFLISFLGQGMNFGEALWSSIYHSVSTFCTAGFALYNDSFESMRDDVFINIVISILAITGSMGFIVVTDIWNRIRGKSDKITFTTKIIFYGFAILLSAGTLFFYFSEPLVMSLSWDKRLLASFFQAMTAMTTVGFNTIPLGSLAMPMIVLTVFLMYVGASPSGTAGGMKITTLTAMLSILWSRLRGDKRINFLNRTIPFERLYVATSTFILYTSIIFLATFLLSFTEVHSLDKIVFETASALGTVGVSMGITGDLSNAGKIIVICLMFIGRVGVLTFGFALLARQNKEEIQSIEDDLAI